MSQVLQLFSHGARALSWMLHGACQRVDPELFFPIAGTARQVEAAKAVCAACAVRASCLSYALAAKPEGIWGGTTEEERRAARGSPVRLARLAAGQQVARRRTA
jgi:WhiB family transcriptional regulator, redox-sensing transcriptional regulator